MKLLYPCFECIQQKISALRSKEIDINSLSISFNLSDDGIYESECNAGHKNIICIQAQKYEILFDIGVMALLDGYLIEAVVDFTSSFELFREFNLKIVSHKNGIDFDEFNKNWRHVSNQSERQLGGFLFFYLLDQKKTVDFMCQDKINFRNKVIHKGYFPNYKEVYDYGEYIYNSIIPLYYDLRLKYMESIYSYLFHELQIKRLKIPDGFPKNQGCLGTIISTADGNSKDPVTFNEAIDNFKIHRHKIYKSN
jgi:hypothetical protein